MYNGLQHMCDTCRAVQTSVAHVEHAAKSCGRQLHYAAASADFTGVRAAQPLSPTAKAWADTKRAELRSLMWQAAGIVRSTKELTRALERIAAMHVEIKAMHKSCGVNAILVELYNLVTVAELIVASALQRKESRGLHYVTDFPRAVEALRQPTVISKGGKTRVPQGSPQGQNGNGSAQGQNGNGSKKSMVSSKVLGGGDGAGMKKLASFRRDMSVRSKPKDEM
jgi:Fumarate reductase flavoprotein C-term